MAAAAAAYGQRPAYSASSNGQGQDGIAAQSRSGSGGGGHAGSSSVTSLYALCAHVPLIKSPAVRVPPPIQLPQTLHPLPPNVQDYFVYPFSLERFVLDAADRREDARRKDLHRRAPGWNETSDVLEPTRRPQAMATALQRSNPAFDGHPTARPPGEHEADEIAQMLDRLESL